jgi:hypothetical protein
MALLGLSQLLLPALATKRVSSRVARYGTVKRARVSAFPAFELLWGDADSASVSAASLTLTTAQIASLLWEARGVSDMVVTADTANLRVAGLPNGLTLTHLRMEKHDSSVHASATLTQRQLDEALTNGFHVEPLASGGGQVEVRASGGFFGLQASISALVKPLAGDLIVEPRTLPLAGLATVTLFADPHLKVLSVGVQPLSGQPLSYRLSLSASLR